MKIMIFKPDVIVIITHNQPVKAKIQCTLLANEFQRNYSASSIDTCVRKCNYSRKTIRASSIHNFFWKWDSNRHYFCWTFIHILLRLQVWRINNAAMSAIDATFSWISAKRRSRPAVCSGIITENEKPHFQFVSYVQLDILHSVLI